MDNMILLISYPWSKMFLQLVKKLEKVGTPQTFEVQPYFSEN